MITPKPAFLIFPFGLGLALGFLVVRLGSLAPGSDLAPAFPADVRVGVAAGTLGQESASPSLSPGDLSPADPVGSLQKLLRSDFFAQAAFTYDFVQRLDSAGVEACLKSLAGQPQGMRQLKIEKLLLKKLAEQDPAHALAQALAIPNAHAVRELATDLFRSWSERDQTSAWAWATQLPTGLLRNRLLGTVLTERAEKKPAGLAAYIVEIASHPGTGSIYRDAATVVAQHLAGADPEALRKFLAQLPDGPAKIKSTLAAAKVMREKDPQAAAELLAGGRQNGEVASALQQTLAQWAKTDLPKALDFAQTLTGQARSNTLSDLLPKFAARDLPAALVLVAQIDDPSVNAKLARQLPILFQVKTPQDALAAANRIPAGELRDQFLINYDRDLARKNPSAAAAYAAKFSDGRAKNDLISQIGAEWIKSDPVQARAWLQSLPSGPARDVGITATFSVRAPPEQKLQLTLLLSDPALRNDYLNQNYSAWNYADPAAARAWLAQANLPDSVKKGLNP